MKNVKNLMLLAFLSLAVISCKKDDDGGNNSSDDNFFSLDGTNYELEDGIIINYGSFNNVSNFDISLFTTDLNFVGEEPEPEDNIFSGLYFEIYTEEANKIPVGTYTFSNTEENSIEPGIFTDYSEVMIKFNYNQEEAEEIILITGGTFEVIKNSPEYELNFSLTLENGKTLTGAYNDDLKELDYSDDLGKGMTNKKRFLKK